MLAALPRNTPQGANTALLHGRHCCAPYVVPVPLSLKMCVDPKKAGSFIVHVGEGDETLC
jgi:hypothetical protein